MDVSSKLYSDKPTNKKTFLVKKKKVTTVDLDRKKSKNFMPVINAKLSQKFTLPKEKTLRETPISSEASINEDNQTRYEIIGPQLKLNKLYLSFYIETGFVDTDKIIVDNNGSTAIYYEWVKLDNHYYYNNTQKDSTERFFCHHVEI